jgi:hypothetical protein
MKEHHRSGTDFAKGISFGVDGQLLYTPPFKKGCD